MVSKGVVFFRRVENECVPDIIEVTSLTADGEVAEGSSGARGISADGRFIHFSNSGGVVVPGDDPSCCDSFVRDIVDGTTEWQSFATLEDGTHEQANARESSGYLSKNGLWFIFVSSASVPMRQPSRCTATEISQELCRYLSL